MSESDITGLLLRWRKGDKSAEALLLDTLYPHLHAAAQRQLRASNYHLSLRATELVSELYFRLLDQREPYASRSHFIAVASRVMRRVLADLMRARSAEKRGADLDQIDLEPGGEADQVPDKYVTDWLTLEEALTTLDRRNSTAARVVELRYFGGLSNEEVATELNVGIATVIRHWQFARAWLHKRL